VASVLTMPDFDLPTRSASGFLLRWIAPRLEPVHLFAILDQRRTFQLSAPQSDIIIGCGHGDTDAFTGQNEVVILEVGKYNPREVSNKVIKLLSCETGVTLGPDLVENGATAFIGYVDDYVWICDADLASMPWQDEIAATSLMPVIDGINALLDGKSTMESVEIELNGYRRNIEMVEDDLLRSCLEFNRDNIVLLGNGDASVKKRPPLAMPFRMVAPPPVILPVLGT